jgi:hypothetical protein
MKIKVCRVTQVIVATPVGCFANWANFSPSHIDGKSGLSRSSPRPAQLLCNASLSASPEKLDFGHQNIHMKDAEQVIDVRKNLRNINDFTFEEHIVILKQIRHSSQEHSGPPTC